MLALQYTTLSSELQLYHQHQHQHHHRHRNYYDPRYYVSIVLKTMNTTELNDAHHIGAMVKKVIIPAFTVEPVEITLRPRTATTFTFRGNCAVPCVLKEVFVLESKIGI